MTGEPESICTLCGAPGATLGVTTIQVGRSGVEITVSGVPAYLCGTCGEAAIPGPLGAALWGAAETMIRAVEQHGAVPAEV